MFGNSTENVGGENFVEKMRDQRAGFTLGNIPYCESLANFTREGIQPTNKRSSCTVEIWWIVRRYVVGIGVVLVVTNGEVELVLISWDVFSADFTTNNELFSFIKTGVLV